MQLQRQAADRAAVEAVGLGQAGPIAVQQGEYPIDGIVHAPPGRLQQHRTDALAIGVEHRHQQILLGGEGIVEAARIDLRLAQDVGDAGGRIPLVGEQAHGREHESFSGG